MYGLNYDLIKMELDLVFGIFSPLKKRDNLYEAYNATRARKYAFEDAKERFWYRLLGIVFWVSLVEIIIKHA